jgi:hypothetical protein
LLLAMVGIFLLASCEALLTMPIPYRSRDWTGD